MAETPRLVTSMGKAEHDRIFVRGYDLNEELLGKISFAQMVCLMLTGKLPTTEQARMIDTMLIVLVDHGMTLQAAIEAPRARLWDGSLVHLVAFPAAKAALSSSA